MADDFEVRVYALLEKFEFGGTAYVEAFKAKGDEARILGDLSDEADDYGFARALVELMADFGVTGAPDLRERNIRVFGPKPTYRMRDMSLRTLKAIIENGQWPPDAWTVRPVSASDWFDWLYGIYIVVAGVCLFGIWAPGKLLMRFLHDPTARAVVDKVVTTSGLIFFTIAILRIVLLLIVWGWQIIFRAWQRVRRREAGI